MTSYQRVSTEHQSISENQSLSENQSISESHLEEPNDPEPTLYPLIPVVSVEAKWTGPLLAVVLQTAVMAVLLTMTFCGVYLRHPGVLSTKDQFLYITGITILAALVTSYTTGQTRKLWVARTIVGEQSALSFSSRKRQQASTAIGLADFQHQLRFWPISLSYLVMGLGTASIVASLSPTVVNVILPIVTEFGPANLVQANCGVSDSEGFICIYNSSKTSPSSTYSWKTSDGTYLAINTTYGNYPWCPTELVRPTLLNLIITQDPYKYSMGAVPVSGTALGAPFRMAGGGFGFAFGTSRAFYDLSQIQWASQCFPVVSKNPVTCQPTGNITVNSDILKITSGNCTISSQLSVDPTSQNASLAGMCTAGRRVGTADILFGSVNGHASQLAAAMNDTGFMGNSYSVTCSVDVLPSFSFRQLNYSRTTLVEGNRIFSGEFTVNATSEETCIPRKLIGDSIHSVPFTPSLDDDLGLVTGAAASWQLLEENKNSDGFGPTLITALDFTRPRSRMFNNSKNSLEDVLGLSSAIALGMYWGCRVASGPPVLEGEMSVTGVRIGPGESWAVLYIMPSLASIVFIIYLVIQVRKQMRSVGG